MNPLEHCSGRDMDRRNQLRITLWSLAWALAFVAAVVAFKEDWIPAGGWRLLAVALTVVLATLAALAYTRFIAQADELRRKIELEALALAFAVGVVGGLGYWMLEAAGLIEEAGLVEVLVVMILAHPAGNLLGHWKYR